MRIDLHLHSTASDGAEDPAHLARLASERNLELWAITDHDTLAGWRQVAGSAGLLCGLEISSVHGGLGLHLLGYGIRPDHPDLTALLEHNRLAREARLVRVLAAVFQATGRRVDPSACRDPRAAVVARRHLAHGLVSSRAVDSYQEAYTRFLGDGVLGEDGYVHSHQAAEIIRAAGGLAILAHPACLGDLDLIERLCRELPLDGLEVRHPHLAPGMDGLLDALVSRHGLVGSAGSDYHRPGLKAIGSHRLPRGRVREFQERLARRQAGL